MSHYLALRAGLACMAYQVTLKLIFRLLFIIMPHIINVLVKQSENVPQPLLPMHTCSMFPRSRNPTFSMSGMRVMKNVACVKSQYWLVPTCRYGCKSVSSAHHAPHLVLFPLFSALLCKRPFVRKMVGSVCRSSDLFVCYSSIFHSCRYLTI